MALLGEELVGVDMVVDGVCFTKFTVRLLRFGRW